MKEEIKELSNEDLLRLYRMLIEHLEYLENEKNKMDEEK